MVNVMLLDNPKDKRMKVTGNYLRFQVWGNAADYTEETAELMQQMARHCFAFPFYVHVETFGDQESMQEMLAFQKHVKLTFRSSGKKIWTMQGGMPVHEELPSFSLQVNDAEELKLVFEEWFHMAQQNFLWVVSQGADVQYEDGTIVFDMLKDSVVLMAEHDGYGFSVITNAEGFKEKREILAVYGA